MAGLACAAFGLFSGCRDEGKTLYLFNWTYYTPQSVLKQFEAEFGVRVRSGEYDSNETMFAKLKAGATGYDIVVPSQDFTSIMIREGMLEKIDHAQFPNAKNIGALVLSKADYDPDMTYSVPYSMSAAGVIVNKAKVPVYEESWNIFARADLAGRMCLLDDMREVFGAALKFNGKSVNSLDDADLAEAKRLVIDSWEPNIVKFDSEGFGKSFAAGDFWVVQGYAENVFAEVPEEQWDSVGFFVPREGGTMYIDSLCIPKGAKHFDLAMQFINFIHRPEVYAQFLDEFRFPPAVNPGAARYTKRAPFCDADALIDCETKNDLGAGVAKYDAAWMDIRAN